MAGAEAPAAGQMDRRQFVKTVGVGGAALAGGAALPGQMAPVQRGRGVCISCGVALIGIGVVAGNYATERWLSSDADPEQITESEDEMHTAAQSIDVWTNEKEAERQSQYLDASNPTLTPFGDAAFRAAETAAAIELEQGNGLSAAIDAARTALDEQATISVYNQINQWNRLLVGDEANPGLDALRRQDESGDFDVFEAPDAISVLGTNSPSDHPDLELVENSEVWGSWPPDTDEDGNNVEPSTNEYTVFKKTWEGAPAKFSNVEDPPENLPTEPTEIYYLAAEDSGGGTPRLFGPSAADGPSWLPSNDTPTTWDIGSLVATHPDRGDVEFFDCTVFRDTLQSVADAHSTMDDPRIPDYVEHLDQALAEGAIDIEDVLGPRQLVDQFSDGTDRAQLAAHAAAMGLPAPEEYGRQVRISHPDLVADSIWTDLYIDWSEGTEPQTLEADMTIQSDQYDTAYAGYFREDNGEYDVQILSGDQGMQILEVGGGDSLEYTETPGYVPPGTDPSPDETEDRLQTSGDTSRNIDEALNDDGSPGLPGLGSIGKGVWDTLILIGLGVLAVWGLGQLGE